MVHPGNPLSRRTALLAGTTLAATAALPWAASPAAAAVYSTPVLAPGTLDRLTARQLAAQRVIFSYPGTTVPQTLLEQISEGLVGGVILFGENVSSLSQITAAVQQMHEAAAAGPIGLPLLVMTDQEGGEVRRLPGGPALSAKQIGESADPGAAAATAGNEAGVLLRGAGLNVNLAPVLDVFRTPGDFDDQFQRSFSDDPQVVATCGTAFITAQQDAGVAATAKHFPGLGPATAAQNTDLGPVTLTTSLHDLLTIDEYPYYPAVGADVRLVMVSWATYTALDPNNPAGLSATIVQRELRSRLGFTGVTITDAINAGALTHLGTPPQNAVKAANAGMDLILEATRSVANGQAVVDSLTDALVDGTLNVPGFDAALHRINALRYSLS